MIHAENRFQKIAWGSSVVLFTLLMVMMLISGASGVEMETVNGGCLQVTFKVRHLLFSLVSQRQSGRSKRTNIENARWFCAVACTLIWAMHRYNVLLYYIRCSRPLQAVSHNVPHSRYSSYCR